MSGEGPTRADIEAATEVYDRLAAPDPRRCIYCGSLICDGCPVCCDKRPRQASATQQATRSGVRLTEEE